MMLWRRNWQGRGKNNDKYGTNEPGTTYKAWRYVLDVLQNEVYHKYRVKKGDKYGKLEVIK